MSSAASAGDAADGLDETVNGAATERGTQAFTRRRRSAIRVLAVVGLLAFGLSVTVVLSDVVTPVANERALEPAGSTEAQLGADRPGESVHVVGAVAALLLDGAGRVALAVRPQQRGRRTTPLRPCSQASRPWASWAPFVWYGIDQALVQRNT